MIQESFWKRKKVMVTGASGFIGSHLVETLLRAGATTIALVHYNGRNDWGNLEFLSDHEKKAIEVKLGDVQDSFFVEKLTHGCDIVFHLSSLIAIPYSYSAPYSYFTTNALGALNVFEACKKNGVSKVIHTSTSEVFGTALYTPIDEKHPLQGQSPYSASKIAADKIAESYYRSFDLPVVTVRPFNTYGPRQSARAVIPTIISQCLGEPQIKLGSLDPVRDLTFVEDTVEAFILAAQSPETIGHEINIGNGQGISIGELAEMIMEVCGSEKALVASDERKRPEKSEVMKLICDNRKASGLIGWRPKHSLKEGIAKTVDHIRNHLNRYKTSAYVV